MVKRLVLFLGILTFTVALAGCSSNERQFARAQRLEQGGKRAEAVQLYAILLTRLGTQAPQRRAAILFRMGECLTALDRVPEAFNAFQKAAETDPLNQGAHLRLGELMLAAGALDGAREQAEIVLRHAGDHSAALALWGASLEGLGQRKAAEEAYRKSLALDPQRVSVAVALADLYNHEDQVTQARQVLEEAAAAAPGNATPWLALARLHEQEGEVVLAEQSYRKAVAAEDTPESNLRLAQFLQRTSRIQEAEQVLRRVDAQRPSEPTALPDFELLAGKPGSALGSYQAALGMKRGITKKTDPKLPGEAARQRALLATRLVEADLEVAQQHSATERTQALQRARGHLDEYRADLDAATIAILEAEIALGEADLPRATLHANTAVSLAAHSAPAHYVLGLVKERAGNTAEAYSEWMAALEQDSHFAPARLALAERTLRAGNAREAEEFVVVVVRDEPGNVKALNLFARVLAAQKRYNAAVLIARRALALDSSAPEPHLVLGEVALARRQAGEALIQFEQAVLLEPHSTAAIEGLTEVYKTGKVTRAMLAKMEQVAKAPPASATLMEIAGRLYAEHGWFQDAKRCLEEALKMDPQRKSAANALARTFAATGNLRAAAESASLSGGNSAALLAGVRAEQRHDVATAIASYERAVRQGDPSGVAANNLAWLYAEQGRNLDRALGLAETARSRAPANPAVLDTVGVVRLRMRNYSEAIRALESAHRLAGSGSAADPQLAEKIREHLTEAYLRAGKTQAAAGLARER